MEGKNLRIHYSGLLQNQVKVRIVTFMVRVRDAKGRYVKKQIPKDLFGPRKVPRINFFDHYSGSSPRVAKI